MFLRQVFDPHLAQFAYVIGCQKTGEAIVIDPLRDIAQYREIASAQGLRITAVAETHIHADFVSGAREIATDGSAHVYVSAEGGAAWQSEWAKDLPQSHLLRDGDTFHIGRIKFQAWHCPGHTPEHLSYLVTDEGGGANEPLAIVSGDFLFVGDVGRPDLLEQAAGQVGTQEAGARQLYHSLKKLAALPDHLLVLPAHGAGSACGKSLGAVPTSTLGYEKKFNHALRLALHDTELAFVDFILEGQPEPPRYFANMKKVNRTGPAILGTIVLPPQWDLPKVEPCLVSQNFVVLDTRSDRKAFAGGHLKGSLFAPVLADFSGFAGSFLDPVEEVLLVVDSEDQVDGLARQLLRIGFDRVVGWLPAGAVAGAPDRLLSHFRAATFAELEEILQATPGAVILDVRRSTEHVAGHIRGALNIAHTRLRCREQEIPVGVPLVVHCQSGMRAAAASAWLVRRGRSVTQVNDAFENVPPSLLA